MRRKWPVRLARRIEKSSFSGLFTRVDIGHIRRLGGKWPHQVMRVGLVAQPADVVAGRKDERHAVVDLGHQFVGVRRDDRERADDPNTFRSGALIQI